MRSIATANVLVTDIMGSTAVLTGEGEQAAERQRHRHDAVVRSVLAVFGGQVVKSTGDGVLAILPSADFAIRAAAALQQAATAEALPLRVGVSTGDVVHEAGDCFGEAVVTAFRLCAQCPVGAALVDAATATVRGGRRDPPVERYDRLTLRGFDRPTDVLRVGIGADNGAVAIGATAEAPLVGRDELVDRVGSAWRSRPGSLVTLLGVPGIGKTHLAAAISRTTGPSPWWVTFELQQTDGFARWCATADERARALPVGLLASLGPTVLGRLTSFLPSIAERLPVTPASISPDSDRKDSFSALIDFVRVAGRDSIMVLDDVQWAGASFHAFLEALVASSHVHRVDLLATCRQPMPPNLNALGSTVVELGQLAVDEVGEILAQRGVAPAVAAVAARQSGGNPLLAVMAARPGASPVDDPMAGRFLALPPDELDVLAVAALIGRTVDLPLITRLTGASIDDVAAHLDAAVRIGLLRRQGGALVFVHDLVREAAERQLAAHRLALLHARAAEGLGGRGDVAGALRHCLDGFVAMEPDDAVDRVSEGCAALSERMSFEDVVIIAGRLADIVAADARCRPRHLAAAKLIESRAHQALGDVEAHKRSARSAGRAASADNDHRLLATAAIERAAWGIAGIPDPDTNRLLDDALARTPPADEALRAKLMSMKAFYLVNYEARGEEARAWGVDAIQVAWQSEDLHALTMALENFSFVLNASSRVVDHTAVLDELESLSGLEPRFGERDTTLHRHSAIVKLQLADRAGFAVHHAWVAELSRQQSSWVLASIATLWDGLVALLDGRPDEAETHAWALLERHDHNFTASAAGVLTAASRWRGTLGKTIGQVIDFARKQPGLPIAASMAAVGAAIGGDRSTAAQLVDELLSRPSLLADDSTLAGQLALLTEACTLVGRPIPGEVIDRLTPFTGQLLVLAWGVDLPGAADRYLAIAMAQAGDRDGASAAFARAAQLERRVSAVVPLRTEVWRHALLGGVAPGPHNPDLAGLDAESTALATVLGT